MNTPSFSFRRDKGQAVLETVGAMIMLLISTMAIFALGMHIYFLTSLNASAREGVRIAAMDYQLLTNPSSTLSQVQTAVINNFKGVTGQTLPAGNITLTGPTGATTGYRTVQVAVSYSWTNPFGGISTLINAFGGDGNWLKTIPMSSSATMRYEE